MKNNIRSKISGFLTSEEGHVGVKPPLVLGAASTSLLLAQAVVTPTVQAHFKCYPWTDDCPEGESCVLWCEKWNSSTCIEWHTHCKSLDS